MPPRVVARLTAPIAVVSVLLLGLAIIAAWYVRDMQQRASGPIAASVASVTAAQELEISIREVSSQLNRYLITGNSKYLDPVPRLKQRTAEALAAAEAAAITPAEESLMRRTRQGYDHFFAQYDQAVHNPPPEGKYFKIIELTDTVLTREILEPAHEYLRLNEGVLKQASETNQQLARRLSILLIAAGFCGSVGGLLGGWVIAVSLRRSMQDTERVLQDTAARLGEAANVPTGLPPPDTSENTLQQVTRAAAAVLNRLKQTERDALRAEQLAWAGQMAAAIAHEVRNPLTVIKLLVQTATDPRRATGFRPRDLRVLEGEILRLEQILSMFLDFARPPRAYKKLVSTRELIDECLAGIGARAELQGVEVRLDAPLELPPLDADPGQLKQVIYNVMFNALDVLVTGGNLWVTVTDSDATLTIRIADSGPGLPPGLGDRIFDPFVSTKETGLGLGLSICRRIVQSHGGSIRAFNGPNAGAVFEITLPCVCETPGIRNGALPKPAVKRPS